MIEQVKGTRNLFGAESEKYIHIFNAFCDAFVDYGYEFVELPILEHKELFIKSIGENSEIVTKQMYEFKDKGNRSLVLRPEATASVVRFHNEFFKKNNLSKTDLKNLGLLSERGNFLFKNRLIFVLYL